MDSENTQQDIQNFLNHIKNTAHELLAWMEKQEHVFSIVVIHDGICIQGNHTSNIYKCVGKDKANLSFNQILENFMNDKGVLNEGLSMILDDVAVLIRLID